MKLKDINPTKCKKCGAKIGKGGRDHRMGICDKHVYESVLTEAKAGYLAYEVPSSARKELIKRFPPKFPEVIGHHITKKFGVPQPETALKQTATITVIGHVEEDGLEALVVEVNGSSARPDGKVYHITWSLDRSKGKKPVMSNVLLAREQFTPVEHYSFKAPLKFFW